MNYYIEIKDVDTNFGCIIQSKLFKTKKQAKDWAKEILFTSGLFVVLKCQKTDTELENLQSGGVA